MKILLILWLLVVAHSALAASAGTALHVTVSYGPAAEGYQRAFSGEYLKVQAGTGEGLTGTTLGTVTAGVLSVMDPVPATIARPPSDLIADLITKINANISGMTSTMVAAMRGQNAATGVLEWKQDVLLPNNQKGVLAWRMMVDTGGSARYGTPEVLPADMLTLDVVYTPLALSALLPSSWPRYAEAGQLKWRLLDKNGTARTAWTSLDAHGAFDNPESTGNAVDPDAGLKCLILDRTRCGGSTDVKTLMDQQGTVGAFVTYIRRLAPVYDYIADPDHAGEYLQQPRLSLSVDTRQLSSNGCGQSLTYQNQGTFGYTLSTKAEKYQVDAALRYFPVDWSEEVRLSPTEHYDKSVSVARADSAAMAGKIITPGPTGNDLLNASDVVGLIYLAPVTQQGNAQQGLLAESFAYIHGGSCGRGFYLGVRCNDSANKIEVGASIITADCGLTGDASRSRSWGDGGDISLPYSRISFTPGVAGNAALFASNSSGGEGNYGFGFMNVSYDGRNRVTVSAPNTWQFAANVAYAGDTWSPMLVRVWPYLQNVPGWPMNGAIITPPNYMYLIGGESLMVCGEYSCPAIFNGWSFSW